MAENSQYVYVAAPKAGGAVWSAPSTATAPTDAVSTLGSEFKGLGFISEDGIVNAEETDTEDIPAFGGKIVKTVKTSRKETYTFTPLETNSNVLAERYGEDNVTVGTNGAITIAHNGNKRAARIYVFEFVLDDNKVQRDVVPLGRITEYGEKAYKDGEAIASEFTLTCEQDSAGNTAYSYIAEISDAS